MCNADLAPDVWHRDGPGGVGKVHFDTMVCVARAIRLFGDIIHSSVYFLFSTHV